jgi:hypothetical protein
MVKTSCDAGNLNNLLKNSKEHYSFGVWVKIREKEEP